MSQKKPGAEVDVHKLGCLKVHICKAGQCCKNLLRIFETHTQRVCSTGGKLRCSANWRKWMRKLQTCYSPLLHEVALWKQQQMTRNLNWKLIKPGIASGGACRKQWQTERTVRLHLGEHHCTHPDHQYHDDEDDDGDDQHDGVWVGWEGSNGKK